jgi:thioredoxin-related protein
MKKITIIFLSLLAQLSVNAQQTGILKEHAWQHLFVQAAKQHKYIVVDYYATWCGPCKKMDREVYTDLNVKAALDSNFLMQKLQMDTSAGDDTAIKENYALAHDFGVTYAVHSLPAFLFFNPDGELVHEAIGYKNAQEFVRLLDVARNPSRQYFTLLKAYRESERYAMLPYLAETSRDLGDEKTSRELSRRYITDSLLQLPSTQLFTRENLEFISSFTYSSNDPGFKLFLNEGKKVDSVTRDLLKIALLSRIIEQEEINNKLYHNGQPFQTDSTPDWKRFQRAIQKKYGPELAKSVVLWAEIKWAEHVANWSLYCRLLVEKVDRYGPYFKFYPYAKAFANYNFPAWELFECSTDKKILKTALGWSERAIAESPQPNVEYMDTKANILYKLGQVTQAIELEKTALLQSPTALDIKANLAKMELGQKTWQPGQ